MDIVIGILLIISALFLVIAVMLQDGKDKSLSGAIAGGSDTFYGKNKGKSTDRLLSRITMIIAIVFASLVLVSFVIQDDTDLKTLRDQLTATEAVTETPAETEARQKLIRQILEDCF